MKNPKSETRNPNCRPAGRSQESETAKRMPLLFALALVLPLPLRAQTNYTIDWFSVDGGGGASTGGVYSVSATLGQPDAGGPVTNGQFALTGGFWALPVVMPETNAPTLSIVTAGSGQAIISWSPNAPGFGLQETWGMSPVAWSNSPSGATNPIAVPTASPAKFYRLLKP